MLLRANACCLLVLAVLVSAAAARGQEPASPTPRPAVQVRIEDRQPSLQRDRAVLSAETLRQQRCRDGCTQMTLQLRSKLDATFVRFSDGEGSYWVSAIDIVLSYQAIDVYVSPRYRPGTCEYQAVWGHEEQHLKADHKVVERTAEAIRTALLAAEWPTYAQPLRVEDLSAGQERTRAQVSALMAPLVEDLKRERQKASEALDATGEAQVIFDACRR